MTLTAFERLLILGAILTVAYRTITDEWPVSVDVEES